MSKSTPKLQPTIDNQKLQSKFFGPDATRFWVFVPDHAQIIYDELFRHVPQNFHAYKENDVDAHCTVVLDHPVQVDEIVFRIVSVKREPDGRLMGRMFIEHPKELAQHLQACKVSLTGVCELGNYIGSGGIGSAFHLKYLMRELPDYMLRAVPTTDPAFEDYI